MTLMTTAAILFLIILGALTVFQLALICGAPLGRFAWGGKHKVLPARLRVASVTSIIIYLIMAAFVLSKSGLWEVIPNPTVVTIGLWVMFAYFVLGVVMNAMSRSKLERAVMTPIALALAISTGVVAWSPVPMNSIDSFQSCKDAGGAIMESYPEQCAIDGKTFVNTAQVKTDGYVGLSEQAALDKAESENKPARVVERDGESLIITMDFNPDRLNLYVRDGNVYKVVVEGGQ